MTDTQSQNPHQAAKTEDSTRKDTLLTRLQKTFAEHSENRVIVEYYHPLENDLLAKLKTDLAQCTTGQRLLNMAQDHKITVRVLRGASAQALGLGGKNVFIAIPAEQTHIHAKNILEFGAALREAEQEIMGFRLPAEGADPLDFASSFHAKYLDIISYMCKMTKEFAKTTLEKEFVDAIVQMGHGNLYETYLSESQSELVDTYFATNT